MSRTPNPRPEPPTASPEPEPPARQAVTCGGRAVDRHGRLHGKPCGRVAHRRCPDCGDETPGGRARHVAEVICRARAIGWRVGGERPDGGHDAMCPKCARPSGGAVWRESPTQTPTVDPRQDPLPLEPPVG